MALIPRQGRKSAKRTVSSIVAMYVDAPSWKIDWGFGREMGLMWCGWLEKERHKECVKKEAATGHDIWFVWVDVGQKVGIYI
jgi:hypothetical protein